MKLKVRFGYRAGSLNEFHLTCLYSIFAAEERDHVLNSTILHVAGSYDLITTRRQRYLRFQGHVHRYADVRLH